jgi:hypothetical protein
VVQKVWYGHGRTYAISSPLDWVVFTVDQGMAAIPWARRKVERIENCILKKGLVLLVVMRMRMMGRKKASAGT